MGKPLRVLIVEDSEDDALLVIRELERGGYDATFERVETAEAMTAALKKQAWDVIITDYKMPHFSAPAALELLKKTGLDLPSIVVSGTVGEETAVATMKAGAHDYLMKDNLTRLVPAIERELHEGEVRKERKLVQEELRIAEQNFRNSLDNSPLGIRIVTAEGETIYANQAILDIYGYSSVEELKATPVKKRYTPESYAEFQERVKRRKLGKPYPPSYEVSIVRKDGEIRHLVLSRKEVVWGGEAQYQVIHQDITERKRAEEEMRVKDNAIGSSINAIAIADLEGNLTYVNHAFLRMWGYDDEKEILGKNAVEFWQVAEEAVEVMQESLDKEGWIGELVAKRKDGSIFNVQLAASVVRDESGRPICRSASFIDITERKRAEEALRKSEENFRHSLDNSPLGVRIVTAEGETIYANRATLDIYGCSSIEEFKSIPAVERHTPKSYAERQERVRKREAGEPVPDYFEQSIIRKDGEVRNLEVFNREVLWGGEKQFQLIYHDATERKQAEEALRGSEEKYRTLTENVNIGIYRVTPGPKGNFIEMNPAFIKMFGYKSRKEMFSINVADIYQNPKERKKFSDKVIRQGFATGEELQLKKMDGTPLIASVSAVIVRAGEKGVGRDDTGNILYFDGIMEDITERKRAEEEIKRAAEEWRTTFDSIADLVSIHDKDFRLVRVNKAFADALKMKPKEVVGKTCYQVIHGTNEPVLLCPHKQTLEDGKPHTAEFFEPHLGIHLEMSTSPIFNEKGEIVGTVHIAKDISERIKMREQLIVTDRLASIGELSSGIAHELNNPLTGVIGFSDLLLSKDVPDDIKEDLEVINKEAKRTAEVVKNLLTFARKREPEKQPVDISNIVKTVLELRAYEQRVNNIQVNTQFAPDLPEVVADGFQLQQVFLNIIINAEHFMTEAHGRGILTITTERVGNIIRASFADDGPGIAKENLRHIFDPFFTTKEVGKGTGLGLSICHGIITEHGGRIYAESKLGKGAIFVVELPISK